MKKLCSSRWRKGRCKISAMEKVILDTFSTEAYQPSNPAFIFSSRARLSMFYSEVNPTMLLILWSITLVIQPRWLDGTSLTQGYMSLHNSFWGNDVGDDRLHTCNLPTSYLCGFPGASGGHCLKRDARSICFA